MKLSLIYTTFYLLALVRLCNVEAQAQTSAKEFYERGFMRQFYQSWSGRYKAGDLDGASADLDRAIALDPKLVSAWNSRGIVRFANGDPGVALAD
jgi:tetratricopeptide repeat protein